MKVNVNIAWSDIADPFMLSLFITTVSMHHQVEKLAHTSLAMFDYARACIYVASYTVGIENG